jgi:hypothetical protein
MKKVAIFGLLALELAFSGCGSSSPTTAASDTSGVWQAVMSGGAGEASALSFVTKFSVNGDGSLTISSFNFLNTDPQACFVSGQTESGTANVSTDSTGLVTGTVTYVVQSGTPAGNTLTLTGTENGTTITGTWALTGSGACTGSGNFTMTRSAS